MGLEGMVQYLDFLRQIVSVKLADRVRERKTLATIIDDVRKQVSSAENKYGFSTYGGNPEKLAAYLQSEDFDLLVDLFKAAGALDVLAEILEEARRAYEGLPDVPEAIDKRLREIGESAGRAEGEAGD